jgi:hypothetical protein
MCINALTVASKLTVIAVGQPHKVEHSEATVVLFCNGELTVSE